MYVVDFANDKRWEGNKTENGKLNLRFRTISNANPQKNENEIFGGKCFRFRPRQALAYSFRKNLNTSVKGASSGWPENDFF